MAGWLARHGEAQNKQRQPCMNSESRVHLQTLDKCQNVKRRGLPPFLKALSQTSGCPDVESFDCLGDLRMRLGGLEASAPLGGKKGKGKGLIGGKGQVETMTRVDIG